MTVEAHPTLRDVPGDPNRKETAVSAFSDTELAYLHNDEFKLARLATVDPAGDPHVVPTGWSHNREHDTIDITGMTLEATQKYRNVARTGRAAVVIDDVLPPWRPRAVLVKGAAEARDGCIRIHPERITSWGIDSEVLGERQSRTVN